MESTFTCVGVEDAPTVMEVLALAGFPPESVSDAVIVWFPLLSVLVKLAPVPICPSLLEVHTKDDAMLPSSGSVAVPWNAMLAPAEKLEPVEGLTIDTNGGTSCGGGGSSPTAAGAQITPSRCPSKVYSSSGESNGAVPKRSTLLRIRVRADSGASVSPRLSSFSHMRATTPATCGEAILVPESSVVPPSSAKDRIPVDSRKQEPEKS